MRPEVSSGDGMGFKLALERHEGLRDGQLARCNHYSTRGPHSQHPLAMS